ncbi:hypothetical protein [Streptomyces sp. NPDC047070]|uniref:hypothetical protein n=1 Tax=Streptomyces sp. NPDC047070 TaxID=3154923 RepID=UPI003452AE10
MFHETVTHAGGDTRGTASESHALMLMRRALNRGYAMEATPEGGAVIRWTRIDLTTRAHADRSILLVPELPVDGLDDSVRALLDLIDLGDATYDCHADRRVITAAGTEIPPGDTARLRARHLVRVDRHNRVRLTMSARLGLLAHGHRQAGGKTDGFAMCSCGLTTHAPDGQTADAKLRGHRQTMTARFIDSISATYAAALTASR